MAASTTASATPSAAIMRNPSHRRKNGAIRKGGVRDWGSTAAQKPNPGEQDGQEVAGVARHREQGKGRPQEGGLQYRRRRVRGAERISALAARAGREARQGERPQDRAPSRLPQPGLAKPPPGGTPAPSP